MRLRYVVLAGLTAAISLMMMTGCGSDASRELARTGLDDEAVLWSRVPQARIDPTEFHAGSGSLFVFADGLVKVPLLDAQLSDVRGDSLTVTLWTRTEIMQDQVRLEMLVDREGDDPRLAQKIMTDVRRTTPWSLIQVGFPVLAGERPLRVRLALIIPGPGKLWVDDVVVWDGAPPVSDGRE